MRCLVFFHAGAGCWEEDLSDYTDWFNKKKKERKKVKSCQKKHSVPRIFRFSWHIRAHVSGGEKQAAIIFVPAVGSLSCSRSFLNISHHVVLLKSKLTIRLVCKFGFTKCLMPIEK